MGGGGLKIGGLFGLILVGVVMLLGGDPRQVMQLLGNGGGAAPTQRAPTSQQQPDQMSEFLRVVMASTEDVWGPLFREDGGQYQRPTLVIFEQRVQSACGMQSSATGPFYCPPDQQLYLDTSFFRQLESMGAAGDFAMAYVVGHEVGHHVQNLIGVADRVRNLQQRQRSRAESNQLQVLLELQADCFAGIWGNRANRNGILLEEGDAEEGLRAAAAIGDDVIQRRAGQRTNVESFTHGTAEQRQQWLARGLRSGRVEQCDTFAAAGVQL